MKGKDAKINRIFTAIGCLAVALALAAFSCFAWFASNNKVQNDLTATVSSGNITDLTINYYSLTGKTESGGTTSYTVGSYLGEQGSSSIKIGGYGSSGSTATLIKVTYTVKDGTTTKIIFAGSGTATFPASEDDENAGCYLTSLSSAVSLRLTGDGSGNGVTTDGGTPTAVSTSQTVKTFYDVTQLQDTGTKQTLTGSNVVFSDIDGTQNSGDGYYYVTEYFVMEYSEDNVFALYPEDATYSNPLNCDPDLNLAVKDNGATDDVDSGSTSSDSTSSDSTSSDSTSSDSTSSDSTSSDSTSSDSSGGSGGGETITVELSYDMSSYYSTDFATTVGTNATTIYFTSSSTYTTETTTAVLAYTTTAGSNSTSSASSTYITTGGKTNSSSGVYGRYFTIDLSNYDGYTVNISATMSSTGSNERYLILSTANSTTDYTTGLAYATSSSSNTQDTLNYGATVTSDNSTLYLTCNESVRVYSIKITLIKTT